MLELEDISLSTGKVRGAKMLLDGVSARFSTANFVAVIGPSGCGKTTLLKVIAGIAKGNESGTVRWMGRNLADQDFHASEIAYVPQFSIAHEQLTAEECVEYSLTLRDAGAGKAGSQTARDLIEEVGLSANAEQLVGTLSGGQRRRLALAMELSSRPHILLCDEVTSGLDPQAEQEIVDLLHRLSRSDGRLILSVTHSLAHLDCYDSVVVLSEGYLAFCGPPSELLNYFAVEHSAGLFARLQEESPKAWAVAWRNWQTLQEQGNLQDRPELTESRFSADAQRRDCPCHLPSSITQFRTLLARRCLILSRCTPQIFLQLSLVFGFPLLVAIFAWGGLPDVRNLDMGLSDNLSRTFDEKRDFLEHASEVGSVVSGIVMFQVVLLTLMGANNSGREIASERAMFEKERLAGLSPFAYVASKAAFLTFFVLLQSLWMWAFVNFVCKIPGDSITQFGFLFLVNASITAICLGISSLMDSAEHASIASIYLVGFQLPLSGAILALPEPLGALVRPFISAYWSWSGFMQTMQTDRHYDIVQSVIQSPLASISMSAAVLVLHISVGLGAALIGCERHRSI